MSGMRAPTPIEILWDKMNEVIEEQNAINERLDVVIKVIDKMLTPPPVEKLAPHD